MRHEISGYTVPPGLLAVLAGLLMSSGTWAEGPRGNDGSVVLRMCKGADKVKALSVMCHSYLNGYVDAARHYGKPGFCLEDGDKEKAPAAVVEWIEAHPEAQSQPAGTVLHKALSEKFSCKGRK
jgi:hypothetical protein